MSEPSDGIRSRRAGETLRFPFWDSREIDPHRGSGVPAGEGKGSDGGNTGIEPKETPHLVQSTPMASTS